MKSICLFQMFTNYSSVCLCFNIYKTRLLSELLTLSHFVELSSISWEVNSIKSVLSFSLDFFVMSSMVLEVLSSMALKLLFPMAVSTVLKVQGWRDMALRLPMVVPMVLELMLMVLVVCSSILSIELWTLLRRAQGTRTLSTWAIWGVWKGFEKCSFL